MAGGSILSWSTPPGTIVLSGPMAAEAASKLFDGPELCTATLGFFSI